jgi:hypothetical protein
VQRKQGTGSASPPLAQMSYGSNSCSSPLKGDERDRAVLARHPKCNAPSHAAGAEISAVTVIIPGAIQQAHAGVAGCLGGVGDILRYRGAG